MKRLSVVLASATLVVALFASVARPSEAEALSYARQSFSTGASPVSVAVGDFNRDGKTDLVTANSGAGTVSVLLGNGAGGFGAKTDFPTGAIPDAGTRSVAVADFNGDGKKDVVTANGSDNSVSVLLGNGNGGLGVKTDFSTGVGPLSVAVADFNGDGKKDVVTANGSDNSVSVLLGNGNGGLGVKTDYATGLGPVCVVAADFNRDGKSDVATANQSDSTWSVLLGNGNGSFGTKVDYATGAWPTSLAVGDINGDGKKDVATTGYTGDVLCLFLGDGSGGFVPVPSYLTPTGRGPWCVAIGDVSGDGNKDLVTANQYGGSLGVWFNNGSGHFAGPRFFMTGPDPRSVAVADFNRDRKPDLVTPSRKDSTVSVLRNTTRPKIASLSPTRGRVGTTLTITGSTAGWSFGATRGTSKVYFGSKAPTKYVYWSKYKIKVRVPLMAKGKKAVTVKTWAGRSNVKYFTVL